MTYEDAATLRAAQRVIARQATARKAIDQSIPGVDSLRVRAALLDAADALETEQ